MTLTITLPETITIPQPEYLRNALIATLYNAGNISEKEACSTLGKTRREFEDMLPLYGLAVLGNRNAEIENELQA